MASSFVYRTVDIDGDDTGIGDRLTGYLIGNGCQQEHDSGGVRFFRYPGLTFSSKKPLTCISRLSLEIVDRENGKAVRFGVTFTRIKAFTIGIFFVICIIVPVVSGMIRSGEPRFTPFALLGIPLGFMVHYHVRWRVFNALRRLVVRSKGSEVDSGIHR